MPDDDTSGLLMYDLDIGVGRTLKIISDPCHTQHPYCCGNGLWTACVELIAVLAGADQAALQSACTRNAKPAGLDMPALDRATGRLGEGQARAGAWRWPGRSRAGTPGQGT